MNNKFNSVVYQDEPITFKETAETNITPQIIRKARLLENKTNTFYQYKETLFYLQAKMLENYEDDYQYGDVYVGYFPTYRDLTDKQLRGYFSWRTKVRKDIIEEAPICFVFIYIYELINQIGVETPLDGYLKLQKFKDNYEKFDNIVSQYIQRWSIDYVIYYGLDKSYLQKTRAVDYDNNLIVLLNLNDYHNEQIIKSFNALSTYKIFNSPFYKKYSSTYEEILIPAFKKIMEYYDNHRKRTLMQDYFYYSENRRIVLFSNCIFSSRNKDYSSIYEISKIRKYECINGAWYTTGYSPYNYPCKKLGELIKTIDAIMRTRFSFKRTLQKAINLKWLDKIINEEIDIYIKNKRTNKKIEIDITKLNDIRYDSLITRDKLIVEDEMLENNEIENKEEVDDNLSNNTVLSKDEMHLINCLLDKKEYKWINEKGLMLSVLIDSINDKLYDIFSDTVIIQEDEVCIIEDYIEDLKGIIKK